MVLIFGCRNLLKSPLQKRFENEFVRNVEGLLPQHRLSINMELFTQDIETQLQAQYPLGGNLEQQKVISKIFMPYGSATWLLLNQDPEDHEYLWCIATLDGQLWEIGSVGKSELVDLEIKPYGEKGPAFKLERDLHFKQINAAEAFNKVISGNYI